MKQITYLKLEDINLLQSKTSLEDKKKLLKKQESIIQILKDSNHFHEVYYNEKNQKHYFNDGCLMKEADINLLLAQILYISNSMEGKCFPVYYKLD